MIPFDGSPLQWAQWCVLHGVWLLCAANALTAIAALGVWRLGRVAPCARIALLLAILALGSTLFIWLAQAHTAANALSAFDTALAMALQNTLHVDTLKVWVPITHLGDGWIRAAIGVVMAVGLLYRQQVRCCVMWVVAVAGIGLLNFSVKLLFERERPLRVHDLVVETSWSFPSGHTSGAVVTYGMLAFLLSQFLPRPTQPAMVLCATAVALNVGLSRVFLQVHFFSDVLAGFAIGSVWLVLCIALTLLPSRRASYA